MPCARVQPATHRCDTRYMRPTVFMATLTAAAGLKPRVLGVTGGIAMGKSTTVKLLSDVYRIPFHDADQCVRRLYAKGGSCVAPVAQAFGGVITVGAIDRAKLGATLTGLPDGERTIAFQTLEAIVHPLVRDDRERFVKDQHCWLVGVDIPLLFETGDKETLGIDHTLVVTCGSEEQKRRALKREGMTPEKLDVILERQLNDAARVARADFTVDTACYDKARARGQTAAVVEQLWGTSPTETAPCRAMSFDLDNTLWPTWPPIATAKDALPSLIQEHLPEVLETFGEGDAAILEGLAAFEKNRDKHGWLSGLEADVRHDITARRRVVYRQLAETYGASTEAGDALAVAYAAVRSEATDAHLDSDALDCITNLREAGIETIGALTNGNAHATGRLGDVLDFWLTAGDVGAAKPRTPPFVAACAQAKCAPAELVHVGDSLTDDVLGALDFGARAIHVGKYDDDATRVAAGAAFKQLPDPSRAAAAADVEKRLEAYGPDRFARVGSLADVPGVVARWRLV